MKVISGTLKGKVIPTLKTHDYRPTLSRIREDVFNLIPVSYTHLTLPTNREV